MKTIGIVERSVVGVDKLMYFLDECNVAGLVSWAGRCSR